MRMWDEAALRKAIEDQGWPEIREVTYQEKTIGFELRESPFGVSIHLYGVAHDMECVDVEINCCGIRLEAKTCAALEKSVSELAVLITKAADLERRFSGRWAMPKK